MREQFLWTEKYRPRTVDECILPDNLKETFNNFVKHENVPNLILTGTSGAGKTTVARAMLDQLKSDYIIINGSLNGNIDTLRNQIQQFASAVSMTGGRKYVILDEADYLNPQSTQPALRNFMEQYASNNGFIFTANFRNRIIDALHSRCSVIDFIIPKACQVKLAGQFFKRVCGILEEEKILFEKPVVAAIIEKYFPDWRRVLNELQRHSHDGKIDSGILSTFATGDIGVLYTSMSNKNFTDVRKWVAENSDNEMEVLFREFYDSASRHFKPSYIPQLVLTLAKYQHMGMNCADPEINMAAFLTEVMIEAEWS
jgi:DNA polymerase III delta prime subunit